LEEKGKGGMRGGEEEERRREVGNRKGVDGRKEGSYEGQGLGEDAVVWKKKELYLSSDQYNLNIKYNSNNMYEIAVRKYLRTYLFKLYGQEV
jgi:hypothetical protein